jgi:hypothetical protein
MALRGRSLPHAPWLQFATSRKHGPLSSAPGSTPDKRPSRIEKWQYGYLVKRIEGRTVIPVLVVSTRQPRPMPS